MLNASSESRLDPKSGLTSDEGCLFGRLLLRWGHRQMGAQRRAKKA